ncbi:type II secretion system protein [Pelomonas sp. KK5]|uniref:type II secretion system protein n=1 Tax=Pelomonas sp. KK5 TaxID=1855730 RepID=UPI00097C18DB|nr:type II secretion system protein [Pelomonas sp. KK5]
MSARPAGRQRGFTYLGLLFFVALLAAGLGMAGELWSTQSQREKEEELLFAGRQIRAAIQSFNDSAPIGQPRRLPATLQELLEDKRWPVTHRHLRRLYVDPMTGKADWLLVRTAAGGIQGVRSRSGVRPFKRSGFAQDEDAFEGADSVGRWVFALDPSSGGSRPNI